MLQCPGPNRSWFLQMSSEKFFHQSDPAYNFRNPFWPIAQSKPSKGLSEREDEVYDLMVNGGSLIQEVFGMNYFDLMEMDPYTFSRFKTKVIEVYEKRRKEQEEQEQQLEQQRRQDEERQRREQQQHK